MQVLLTSLGKDSSHIANGEFDYAGIEIKSMYDHAESLRCADLRELPRLSDKPEGNEEFLFSMFFQSEDPKQDYLETHKQTMEKSEVGDDFVEDCREDPNSVMEFIALHEIDNFGEKTYEANEIFNYFVSSSMVPALSVSTSREVRDYEALPPSPSTNSAAHDSAAFAHSSTQLDKKRCSRSGADSGARTVRRRIEAYKQPELAAGLVRNDASSTHHLAMSQILLALGRSPLRGGGTSSSSDGPYIADRGDSVHKTVTPTTSCSRAQSSSEKDAGCTATETGSVESGETVSSAEEERRERRRRQNREAQRRHRARSRGVHQEALSALY